MDTIRNMATAVRLGMAGDKNLWQRMFGPGRTPGRAMKSGYHFFRGKGRK
ncbi:MAG: hypothetical protein JRJ66_02095 [Deltaproteobacteria bacterium]|nr:hypothetical protein [Deltaproteobacteria bacterium]